jgi:hypothetical protein
MKITPTPVTAALAGVFSAIVWPPMWSRFGSAATAGSLELILVMLLIVALPAHACVVGFGRGGGSPAAGAVDIALLKRVGAWLAAAVATALVGAALRA